MDPKVNADGTLPMWIDPETGHHLPTNATSAVLSGTDPGLHTHDDYADTVHAHVHDHDGSYAAPHSHPYSADNHTHPAGGEHDHLGVYEPVHAHPYSTSDHNHDVAYATAAHAHAAHDHDADYSDTLHDHAGTYEPTHAHPYSADDHTHVAGDHPDLATHEGLGLATDADLTTHAATPHGGEAYGVGDVYITTVNHANGAAVATHHGYGTWARFGAGRFLLLTDTQSEVEAGAATHSHAFTQPSAHTDVITHTHTTDSQGAHVHDEYRNSATTGGLDGWGAGDTSTNNATLTGYDTGSAGAHTHTAAAPAGAVASISHSGGAVTDGSTAPLSITAFAWKRTA
jgi:hypothetical protein